MPTPGSYKKYKDQQVQQLWQWYVGPYDGGRSVQEMESVGQIAWRKKQKHGRARWRQLNLVLQRVLQLQNEGSRVLSGQMAAAKADRERMELGLDLPAYVKHLEGMAICWSLLLTAVAWPLPLCVCLLLSCLFMHLSAAEWLSCEHHAPTSM